MKKYILFDLDGTLTDPALGITNSLMYALDRLGQPYESREALYKFIGPPLVDMMMEEFGFTREKGQQGLQLYREYFKDRGIFENQIYEGIPKMLRTLADAGCKIGLATSKPEEYAIRILEHFGIASYFAFIGGSDMAETRVNKDDVIAYVLENLGASSSDCVMVGDRKYDVEGAAKFGMPCVGVLFGYGGREELESAGAAELAETVADLQEILLNI